MLKKIRRSLAQPSYQLILQVSKQNWLLILMNISSNLFGVFFEGSTLGIIYVAIALLSEGKNSLSEIPLISTWIEAVNVNDELLFLIMLGFAVVCQSFLAISKYLNKVSIALLSANLQPQVTGRIFQQIISLSFDCASRYKVGDLTFFASAGASTVNFQIQVLNDFLISVSFTVVYSLILVNLSPILALIAVILALSLIAVQRYILPRLKVVSRRVIKANKSLPEKMTEMIQALRLVHTFGMQEHAISQIDGALLETKRALIQRGLLFHLSDPFLDIMPILALAVLAAIAYSLDPQSETVLPLLLTFLVALQRLATRLRGVSGSVTRLVDLTAQMQRLDEILTSKDKEFSILGHRSFEQLNTDIDLQNICLSYSEDDFLAIDHLSLTVPKNKVTALVGESGAGKSTLIDLIIGLYQPSQGEIIVNGYSVYDFVQSEWRRKIGVVSQDTVVFNMSILDNLTYGAENISREEAIEVTKAAQAHKFIMDLPDGYETIVGERGYRLSGGQRQRLALARALIKRPDILILDEATSALDSQSERLIQEALDKFQEGRTVIVIAHRLSTIVNADQIVVLDKGQVIEQGNHQTLLEKDGQYAKAWKLQTLSAKA